MDTSSLETNWKWCELNDQDGMIHITNEIIDKEKSIPSNWKPKHIHWTEFSVETRVGWRGPIIMLWDHLKTKKIYYKKNYYGYDL